MGKEGGWVVRLGREGGLWFLGSKGSRVGWMVSFCE